MKDESLPKSDRRVLYWTSEFSAFYNGLSPSVQLKFEYVFNIMQTVYALPSKFAKRLVGSPLYELRVSVGTDEYRTVMFAVDHENIIQATRIVLLNGFQKKSSKDYAKQIEKANKLLKTLEL